MAKQLAEEFGADNVTSLVAATLALRDGGKDWLMTLGVRDLGPERANAVRALLLGVA